MDPGTWERIESICLAALTRPAEARPAFLEEACAGDAGLRQEVESLLERLAANPDFLETPLVRLSDLGVPEDDNDTAPGRRIDAYRLVRTVGRGGMGEVFLAIRETEDVRQPVALKVIRRGMDTDEVLKRFRLERQILASLHHPNIAHLLDAGATEDGRPYFVMEHVEGLRIDEYCNLHKLSVHQRLKLFQTVCSAVQHAHQNLIVHRDIKPSNILVTTDGVPKLLDFGIGKVLAPTHSLTHLTETRTHLRMLTPDYASPEQLKGEPVTTATDVYGLGVLLYELLSGHHPYASGLEAREEIEKAVTTGSPERPSMVVGRTERRVRGGFDVIVTPQEVGAQRSTEPPRLRRILAGDLDNIVLKALRKEPQRRYSTAAALSEDLGRYLEGRPIQARPDTLAYRTGKFIKRHTWGVAAAVLVLIALSGSSVVTLVQSRRVAVERDRAVEVRDFLLEMFGASAADQAVGDSVTARQLLDSQVKGLEAYDDRPILKAEMMAVLAEGYERLGLYADAEPLAREALALRRRVLDAEHTDLAASVNTLGWILHQTAADPDGADSLLSEAVSIRRAAGSRHRADLARSLNDLGAVREVSGDFESADSLYREALAIRRELFGDDHRSVGVTINNLSTMMYRRGDYDEALTLAEEALRVLRTAVGPDHQRSLTVQSNLAVFSAATGDWETAEREYRDLLERWTRVQGRNHPRTASTMAYLASALYRRRELDEAEQLAREALAIQEATLGPAHRDVAATLGYLADIMTARRAYADALQLHERTASIWRDLYGDMHREVGFSVAGMARMHSRLGNLEVAEQLYQQAIVIFEASLGPDHARTTRERIILGRLLLRLERPSEATKAFEEAHAAATRALAARHGLVHESRLRLALARIELGDCETADSLFRVSDAQLDSEAEPRYQNLRRAIRGALNSCVDSAPKP